MKNPFVPRSAPIAALLALIAAGPVMAGFDVDFGAAVQINDRTDLFFRISSRYFEQDRSTITRLAARYEDPDDVAVALFIRHESGRSFDELYTLRRGGLSWWEVGVRLGVPVDAWYVEVDRDPGPPYGKAYGYWKKHKRNPARAIVLSDVQCRDLVALRMAHEYYGVSVDVAAAWRSEGDLRHVMTERYWQRHPGHGNGQSAASDHDRSHGQPKGKGKKQK